MAGDLADAALVFARGHGYTLAARPTVVLMADPRVPAGDVQVAATFDTGQPRPRGHRRQRTGRWSSRSPRSAPRRRRSAAVGRDGREREVRIDGTLLTIGRSPDNGLALDDARVSRHHARLRARHGMLVLTDLDSTNGVRVNGVRVAEVVLGVGDRIEIGDTVLVVDAVASD